MKNKSKLKLIVSVALVILVVAGFVYISFNNFKRKDINNILQNEQIKITEKEKLDSCNSADDIDNSVNKNGYLYIIRKNPNENCREELWKYDQQKRGVNLFSTEKVPLSYEISEDGKLIAIMEHPGELTFIKNDGVILKSFGVISTYSSLFNYSGKWKNTEFWLIDTEEGAPWLVKNIFKINATDFSIIKFDTSRDFIPYFNFQHSVFNLTKGKIIFDDGPFFDDPEGEEVVKKYLPKTEINLIVYDLKTKTKEVIDSSMGIYFKPKWLDENTIEYNDPNGTGRITKQIP